MRNRTWKAVLVCLAGGFALLGTTGCGSSHQAPTAATAAVDNASPMLSADLLGHARLRTVW